MVVTMPNQNTCASGATQARSDVREPSAGPTAACVGIRSDRGRTSIPQERSRCKYAWLAEVKRAVGSEVGRRACKDYTVSHRLVVDLAEEIASGPYPSFSKSGEVWVGQAKLATRLGVHERQVRRAVAVLVALGLVLVERDRREKDTNKMMPLIAGRPLFEAPEPAGYHRASTSSDERASTPSSERAWASSNSQRGKQRRIPPP